MQRHLSLHITSAEIRFLNLNVKHGRDTMKELTVLLKLSAAVTVCLVSEIV